MNLNDNIIAFVLGGGRGTRIYPLTKERSKPAIPIGSKYRIIDIPISNCMNSGINKIFVLTQFNSKSLNQHINNAYRFDHFSEKFVDILPAAQTMDNTNWYQGTADAIRQNIRYIDSFPNCKTVLILSGDQLYNFDFRLLYDLHSKANADVTIATIPVPKNHVGEFGILKIKKNKDFFKIIDFKEKATCSDIIDKFVMKNNKHEKPHCLASMGIYMFKKDVLIDYLNASNKQDFGKELIPQLIKEKLVVPYLFTGYWEDVGTIKAFHKANLDLLGRNPKLKIKPEFPIYTNPRFLPPVFCHNAKIENVILGDGAIVLGGELKNSVIGVRSYINENVYLENSLVLGADWYESDTVQADLLAKGQIPLGIGAGSIIKNTIIDKNVRIGKNVKILNEENLIEYTAPDESYFVKDSIVVIPKGVTIPDNFKI
ncbi:MAG: sugar phosphate nucleotidyltransferase [Candidatus Margulisiibacteriota bacterium]